MTTPPPLPRSQTFYEVATRLNQMVPELAKGMTKGKKVFAKTRRLARGLTNVQDRFKFLSKEFSQAKQAQKELAKLSKEANKVAKEAGVAVEKTTKEVASQGRKWKNLLGKLPGKDDFAKALSGGSALVNVAVIAGLTAVLVAKIVTDIEIQNLGFDNDDRMRSEIQKSFNRYQKNVIDIRSIAKQLAAQKLEDQRTRDRVYGLEKQIVPIREKSNNALYEVRKGREILEGKIKASENSINTRINKISETYQKVRADIDKLISNTQTGINKQIEATLAKLQQAQATNDTKIKQANDSISLQNKIITKLENAINSIKPLTPPTTIDATKIINDAVEKTKQFFNPQLAKIPTVEATANRASLDATEAKNTSNAVKIDLGNLKITTDARINALAIQDSTLFGSIANLNQSIASQNRNIAEIDKKSVVADFGNLQSQLDARFNQIVADNAKALNIRDLSQTELSKQFDKKLADAIRNFDLSSQQRYDKFVAQNNADLKTRDLSQSELSKDLDRRIAALTTDNSRLKTDIDNLDTKIKEQEKVNTDAARDIKQMLPVILALPAKIGAIPNQVVNQVPNISGIEGAVQSGMCKSTAPGGCTKGALDDAVSNINQNSNANKSNILDVLNAGGQAVDLAMLTTINNKLGDAIPGGISGKLVDGFKWLQLDRALNILTFAATVHNAAMLSNDILQTLVGALTNVLTFIIPKDDKGNAFNVGEFINGSVENAVKGIIGTENYTNLTTAWAKASRIYQASTNILNSFQGLAQTILSANELIGAYTGRIGNALKKAGVVLEDAYQWMNPQPKFNRITQGLEALQQGASTIQQVTQVPLDIISQTTELTNAATEFTKAIKEDGKPENKSTTVVEPDTVKAEAIAAKVGSASPEIDLADFFNATN